MRAGLSLLIIAIAAIFAYSRLSSTTQTAFAEQYSPAAGITCMAEGKNRVVTVRGVDSRTSPPASETYTKNGQKVTHQVTLRPVAHEYCMDMIARHIARNPDAP